MSHVAAFSLFFLQIKEDKVGAPERSVRREGKKRGRVLVEEKGNGVKMESAPQPRALT
jgi:hypothetical protein